MRSRDSKGRFTKKSTSGNVTAFFYLFFILGIISSIIFVSQNSSFLQEICEKIYNFLLYSKKIENNS